MEDDDPIELVPGRQTALAAWLRDALARAGLTQGQLARQLYRHRSGIARAIAGQTVPSWPLTSEIAAACGADQAVTRRLWEDALVVAADRARRASEGWPPDGIRDHDALCRALRRLVEHRGLSQRELIRRDRSGVLRRSMVGYVLRGERRVTYRVLTAIVAACGVTGKAAAAWDEEWICAAVPELEARHEARLEGLRTSQGGRLYPRRWVDGRY